MTRLAIDPKALKIASAKLRNTRLETVYGRRERPAETVKSACERALPRVGSDDTVEVLLSKGYSGLGTQEGVEFILKAGIRFYLAALAQSAVSGGGDLTTGSGLP